MNQPAHRPRFTLAEYMAIEPEGNVRHELIDGELVAMTGTSREHNLIVTNLVAALRGHLRGTPCRVASNDMKVIMAKAERGYYPDLLVSCSDPADEPDRYTETRPRLIVEVLSPSTAPFDRDRKRRDYQQIASLQDYVLVAQDEPRVEVYHRQSTGDWLRTLYTAADASVTLASIDLAIEMTPIYEDVLNPGDFLT